MVVSVCSEGGLAEVPQMGGGLLPSRFRVEARLWANGDESQMN